MNYPNIGVAVDLLLSFKVDNPLKIQKKGCKDSDDAIFKCKICNKEFQSFQALGGHCTSHKRHKIRVRGLDMKIKSRGHVCSVCGKEFSTGQSLGGHMRRHRKTSIDSSSNFHFGPLDLKSSDSDVPRLLPLFL